MRTCSAGAMLDDGLVAGGEGVEDARGSRPETLVGPLTRLEPRATHLDGSRAFEQTKRNAMRARELARGGAQQRPCGTTRR